MLVMEQFEALVVNVDDNGVSPKGNVANGT